MEADATTALAALKANPDSAEALAKLQHEADKLGEGQAWDKVAAAYEAALKLVKRGTGEQTLLIALGNVYWQRLKSVEQAEGVFRRVRKTDPRAPEMLNFYRAYHTERAEIPLLLNVFTQALRAEKDEAAQTQLSIDMANLAESEPRTIEKAIDLWKGLLRKQPDMAEAYESLHRLYGKAEKWNALLELLKERLDRLPDTAVDEKVALFQEMVPIYRDRMRLDPMVQSAYLSIRALKPFHQPTLEALTDWFEKKSRWIDLVDVLNSRAQIAANNADKIAFFRRVASLWADKLGKPQNAAGAYDQILQLDPSDADTLAALTDLYTKGRKWGPLIDLLRRQLPGKPPAVVRAGLVEMARLAADRLNDEKQAIAIWNEVLALDPDDTEALAAVSSLYEKERDWTPLADVLGRQAAATADAAALAALLEKRGTILAEKLGDAAAAATDLQRVHELQPDNGRVFRSLRELYGKLGNHAALEALYGARGQWSELCDALTDLADQMPDEKTSVVLRQRVATLAIEQLNQPERAIKAYERIVAIDPGHRQAADALAGLYRNTEKWSRLLETYEARLGESVAAAATEPGEKGKKKKHKEGSKDASLGVPEQLKLMAEARKLCEDKLGSKALAFKWALRALELAQDDHELFVDAERLGREGEEWEPLSELYGRRLKQTSDDEEKMSLLRRALAIAVQKTKRTAEARRLAEALLQVSPNDDDAQGALQQLLAAEEKWPEVVALMHSRQAQLQDPAARAELLLAASRLEEEKLQQPETAQASLNEALALHPGNAKVLTALVRICERRHDFQGLAEVLLQQVEGSADDAERLALLLRLANVQENQLKNKLAAWATYQRAIEVSPDAAEAVAGLERAFDDDDLPAASIHPIAQHLARFYETTENYGRWAEVLQRLAGVSKDRSEKVRHLQLLADLYEGPAADRGAAYGATLQLFELDPADEANLQRLLRLAAEVAKQDDLLLAMHRVLGQAQDNLLRALLLGHVAELEEKQPGHEAKAEKAYLQLLELEPDNERAVAALTRILREGERWADLRNLLDGRAERMVDAKEKLALYAQIAEIDEALLGDREHAVGVLNKQLELEPNNLGTYHGLERLLTALGRWNQLAEVLAREVDLVPKVEEEGIVLRRVEVLSEKIGAFDDALDVLAEILKTNPEHEDALRAVERLLRKPKAKQRAATILGPLYNKAGNWEGLVEVLQIRRASLTGGKAVAALAKVAEIQETKLADEASALATWQTVLDMEPSNKEALAAVERLASMLERPSDLVELYLEMAAKKEQDDLRGRAENLTRAARLCVSSLGDRQRAAQIWQQVLDLDVADPELGQPAAEALEALYPQIGEYTRLVDILKVKLDWQSRPAPRAELLARIADLYEKALGKPDEAVECLREAFEATPEDPKLLDRLEPVFEGRGQWRDLISVLDRRMALAVGNKARRALRWRIAEIQEHKLQDLDEAIATVSSNLDEVGGEKQALDALERLYDKKQAHGSRLEVLERRLALTEAPDERVVWLKRAAAVLAGPLEAPGDALEKWREVLLHAPDDADTLARIEGLLDHNHSDDELRRAAAETLEPVYEARNDWANFARALKIYIDTEDDRRDRMKHWIRLASLRRDQLSDLPGALEGFGSAIKDALGEDNVMELLDTHEQLATKLNRTADVVRLYEEIEPDVLREDVHLRIERRIATDARERGDLEGAATRYLSILDQAPEDPEALEGLEGIYRAQGDQERLYELVLRRAELVQDIPTAELALRTEAGALAAKLERTDDAIMAYERALELSPQGREVIEALQALYEKTERWVDLRGLLERRLSAKILPNEAIKIHERMARLEIDELGNYVAAVEHLHDLFKRDPANEAAVRMAESLLEQPETVMDAAGMLEAVYARRNEWDRLVAIDEARRDHLDDPAARVVYTRRIARTYEENVEDLGKAFEWYGKLFVEVPHERPVQEQLLRLAPKLDRWRDLGTLLDDYLYDEMSETPQVLAIVKLAAEIWDQQLGDRDAARKHYRRYLDAQPTDPKAVALFEQALERWEAWSDLLDLIDEQTTRADLPAARVALLKRSARISETKLDDRDRAARTYRNVLDELPADKEAANELERIYRADERWSDLADLLVARLDVETEPAARREVQLRLAALQAEQLSSVESAVELYGQVLASDPRNAAARGALEMFLSGDNLRLEVATQLEPCYRELQSWDRLVQVLTIRLEEGNDPSMRTVWLQEVAALEERLGNNDLALEARAKVWLEDVANDGALAALEAGVPAARAFPRFVELLLEGAESALDPELQGRLLGKAAMVLETQVGNRPAAIDTWRKALAANPDNDGAFVTLERLLELEGRTAELVALLEQHAEASLDGNARLALSRRAARLSDAELRDPTRGIAAWNQVLDLADGDAEALVALSRHYEAASRWADLSEINQRLLEGASDAQAIRKLRFAAAKLADEKLSDAAEAASQLRLVLDDFPGDPEALEQLDRIYTREAQNLELLEILDLRQQTAPSAAEADAFALRAAKLVQDEMGDVHGALERYRLILDGSPNFKPAREALWALAKDEDAQAAAIAALEPLLRAHNAHGELLELLELKAQAESVPAARIPVLAEMARIEEQVRNDLVKAFALWVRAFKEEPGDDEVRQNLERVTAARGDHARLAKIYEEQFDEIYDTELQRRLALRLGDLYESSLRDPDRALAALRKALELGGGGELALLDRIESLLRQRSKWAELAEVLARRAEMSLDPQAQAGALAALGQIRLERLTDRRGAFEAFRDALERAPGHAEALASLRSLMRIEDLRADVIDVLEPLAQARGDHAELASLYEQKAALADDEVSASSWWRRVGEVCEIELKDAARALAGYGKALSLEPENGQLADDVARVSLGAGSAALGARAIEAALGKVTGSAFVDLAVRAAKLFEQAADAASLGAAESLYKRVLAEDAENLSALEALEALYRGRGDKSMLALTLEQRANVELEPAARVALLSEAATLHEQRGDIKATLAAWENARQADEGNAVVLDALARLYEHEGRYEDLVGIVEEKARQTDDPQVRSRMYVQIGELRATALNDADAAALAFREALDIDPNNDAALNALATLEEQRGDFSALEEVLLQRLSAAGAAEQKILLFRLADNARLKLEDEDRAFGYLRQVLELDPADARAFEGIETVLGAQERWHDLVELYEGRADAARSSAQSAEERRLRLKIAEIWAEKLDSPDSACEAVEALLKSNPDDLATLITLGGLYEKAERYDEAVATLRKAEAAGPRGRQAADLHVRLGRLLQAQGAEGADVQSAFLRALKADASHPEALLALEGIARKANRADELVGILELRERSTSDAAVRLKLLKEIVELYRGPLDNPAGGTSALENLVALAPDDLDVKEAYGQSLMEAGRTAEGEALLESLIAGLTQKRQMKAVARLRTTLGLAAQTRGDLSKAVAHLEAAQQLDASSPRVAVALGRLAEASGDRPKAFKFYRNLLLLTFDENAAGITKAEVYLALARLHVAEGETLKARGMVDRGLGVTPDHQGLRALQEDLKRA